MYGFFEVTTPTTKRDAFNGAAFGSIAEALAHVEAVTVFAEVDEGNDAADVFTKTGVVYAIERI
ncbi:MAG TPA: hypothetical protein VJP88_08635 [Caulobacteraceae bacterium]|nr:hypothetical protein [Caulobacteraceae bacterium]